MTPSDAFTDALYETLELWFTEHLSPGEAAKAKEQILDADDQLVPRIVELVRIELQEKMEKP